MNEVVTAEKEAEIRRENIARLTSEAPVERRNLTVDSAYELQREQQDEAADEAARQALQAATETEEPVPDPPAQLQWTTQEIGYFQQLTQTEAALQAKWDELYALDLNELEATDKARAAQVRTDRKELDRQITEYAQRFLAGLMYLAWKQHEHVRAHEFKKLVAKWPELANKANRDAIVKHALQNGYTEREISSCLDHRRIGEYWERMKLEQQQPKKPKGKIPTARKQPPEPEGPTELDLAIEQANSSRGLSRETASLIMRSPKRGPRTENVEALKARLRQTGSLDDAFAYMQARRAGR